MTAIHDINMYVQYHNYLTCKAFEPLFGDDEDKSMIWKSL